LDYPAHETYCQDKSFSVLRHAVFAGSAAVKAGQCCPDREDEKFDMGSQENKKSLVTYIFKRNAQKARYSGSDASRIRSNYETDVKETNFLFRNTFNHFSIRLYQNIANYNCLRHFLLV
jgi:hypothetical protein